MGKKDGSNSYLGWVASIIAADANRIITKEKSYKGSWKKRGGVGAFMMLARKWDRMEAACEDNHYDIFHVINNDERKEPILQDIRDLRGYLILVEAEMLERKKLGDYKGETYVPPDKLEDWLNNWEDLFGTDKPSIRDWEGKLYDLPALTPTDYRSHTMDCNCDLCCSEKELKYDEEKDKE